MQTLQSIGQGARLPEVQDKWQEERGGGGGDLEIEILKDLVVRPSWVLEAHTGKLNAAHHGGQDSAALREAVIMAARISMGCNTPPPPPSAVGNTSPSQRGNAAPTSSGAYRKRDSARVIHVLEDTCSSACGADGRADEDGQLRHGALHGLRGDEELHQLAGGYLVALHEGTAIIDDAQHDAVDEEVGAGRKQAHTQTCRRTTSDGPTGGGMHMSDGGGARVEAQGAGTQDGVILFVLFFFGERG